MEGGESPLEVLSRAATMVQENQQALANSEDALKQSATTASNNIINNNKQLPTAKWKRDRRTTRLPEYQSRKSDPKIAETFGTEASHQPNSPMETAAVQHNQQYSTSSTNNGTSSVAAAATTNGVGSNGFNLTNHDQEISNNSPIDMSVRQRGLPPSYAQTISNPGYRSNYRPSVIQNSVPPPATRDELPPGISMCDPIIDEHFRRSLGNDYVALFSNNNVVPSKDQPAVPPLVLTSANNTRASPVSPTTNASKSLVHMGISSNSNSSNGSSTGPPSPATTHVIELMDSAGLSVDDHFAKALGETWAKLNNGTTSNGKKDQELKSRGSKENHHGLVST